MGNLHLQMNRVVISIVMILAATLYGCGSNLPEEDPGSDTPLAIPTNAPLNGSTLSSLTGDNVVALSINGSTCTDTSSPNKPCVSVKICAPTDLSNCQTLNDIILDTGSVGFRVFKSALIPSIASSLSPIQISGKTLAECIEYGDGYQFWGPIQKARMILGNEPSIEIPIHVFDSAFATPPDSCASPIETPAQAGYNGILGVGLFARDCGSVCETQRNNKLYYQCNGSGSGSTCSGAAVKSLSQVSNPVALLPQDNNGVIVQLPSVPLGGAPSIEGYLLLGIGTQPNNIPKNVTPYPTDANGTFFVSFEGTDYAGIIDSASNSLYLPNPSSATLPDCKLADATFSGWFCPSSATNLSLITSGASGEAQSIIPFQIGNFMELSKSKNNVFSELGGQSQPAGTEVLYLGLPFFFGRNVYVGIDGTTSSLGKGPYWAY